MKIYSVFVACRLHYINDPSLEKATESSQFIFQVTFLYNYLYRIYLLPRIREIGVLQFCFQKAVAWQVVVDVNSWNKLQHRYFTLRTPCSLISHMSHSLLHTLLWHAPASILYITYTGFADQLYVTQSIAHCSVSIRHPYFALIHTVFADQPYVTQSVAHCSVTICDYKSGVTG